jgi:AraC-like DNA-binding protein
MIYVEPWLLRRALGGGDLPFVHSVVAEDRELFRLLEEIFSGFPDPLAPLERDGHLARLADLMRRRAGGKISAGRFLPHSAVDRGRVFIDEEFRRPIDSTMLEKVTGLDRFEFARVFRHVTGTSPHRYLVGRRLAAARHAILQHAELADVAHWAGFSDQSHMTRHFKARYGITPGRLAALAKSGMNRSGADRRRRSPAGDPGKGAPANSDPFLLQ